MAAASALFRASRDWYPFIDTVCHNPIRSRSGEGWAIGVEGLASGDFVGIFASLFCTAGFVWCAGSASQQGIC
jgi:hypothetical protein